MWCVLWMFSGAIAGDLVLTEGDVRYDVLSEDQSAVVGSTDSFDAAVALLGDRDPVLCRGLSITEEGPVVENGLSRWRWRASDHPQAVCGSCFLVRRQCNVRSHAVEAMPVRNMQALRSRREALSSMVPSVAAGASPTVVMDGVVVSGLQAGRLRHLP